MLPLHAGADVTKGTFTPGEGVRVFRALSPLVSTPEHLSHTGSCCSPRPSLHAAPRGQINTVSILPLPAYFNAPTLPPPPQVMARRNAEPFASARTCSDPLVIIKPELIHFLLRRRAGLFQEGFSVRERERGIGEEGERFTLQPATRKEINRKRRRVDVRLLRSLFASELFVTRGGCEWLSAGSLTHTQTDVISFVLFHHRKL